MERKNVINIINFIRGNDPRENQEELLDTFRRQIDMCKDFGMPCTFLLQYDAIVKPEYTSLLLEADEKTEVGVWIEMAREQVEKVGIKWNGRPGFDWDWHVNPDMLAAYTQKQREMLIDELMERFKSVFGYYPKSAGSWLIDSYSIEYMQKKYGIKAVCICREQFGTDGYTLWGGYFNQGYYPCKKNMLIPAQSEEEQISVPVFRMLGTDPIHQYDMALDENFNCPEIQAKVSTMEPTCWSGKNEKWVDWYLKSVFEEEAISFAYTQIGQENSFTWKNFGEALLMQMRKISEGESLGKWDVMTLKDTGVWFSERYKMTPATAVTALSDLDDKNNQTVWYDCKNYRANIHIRNGKICFRDIFLFDEKYTDRYYETPATGNTADYDALPIIDGCLWGGNGINSVLGFVNPENGQKLDATITDITSNDSNLSAKVETELGMLTIILNENDISIELPNNEIRLKFEYNRLDKTELVKIEKNTILYSHFGAEYGIKTTGNVSSTESGYVINADEKLKIEFFSNL